MNEERLKEIEAKDLLSGAHPSIDTGGCVMEMVSYLANEPWSDHPKCACPILTEYAIRINDRFTDEHRQLLKPFIPMLMNTKATDDVQFARKRLIRWRNVTALYPMILDVLKLTELSAQLRATGNNLEDMARAAKVLRENEDLIRKTYRADAYANADADAYANADAYADAYADADAYAYAYADAYAYANAYANAKFVGQWRAKIAECALETLRLAIEVKA